VQDIRNQLAAAVLRDYHAAALELADTARAVLRSFVCRGHEVELKPDGSLVTNADIEVERRLSAALNARFPEHGVIGEEFPAINPRAEFQWILDPIDGTEDYVRGLPYFGSIIALHYRGQPVVGIIDHPALDLRCSAVFGGGATRNGVEITVAHDTGWQDRSNEVIALATRANFTRYVDDGMTFESLLRANQNVRIFRTCYAHTCAVTGMTDAMVEWEVRPWDIAATRLLVEESGGKYVTLRDIDRPGVGRVHSAVFGRPETVDRLLALLRPLGGCSRE